MKDQATLILRMVAAGQLPRNLYKYRSMSEHTLDIFRKCELYFSAPVDFNDPFDCKFAPVITSQTKLAEAIAARQNLGYEEEAVKATIANEVDITAKISKAVDRVMNNHGICCFSKKCDDILMWSHYSDSHKGVCLEFDVAEDPNFFAFPMVVKYQDAYPMIDISPKEGMAKYVTLLLSTKFSAWSYEQEVRVCKMKNDAYKFKPLALKSVIFGCKSDDATIQKVATVVKNNPSLQHVMFYKEVMDEKAYKLNLINTF